jgi:hypothetical protein
MDFPFCRHLVSTAFFVDLLWANLRADYPCTAHYAPQGNKAQMVYKTDVPLAHTLLFGLHTMPTTRKQCTMTMCASVFQVCITYCYLHTNETSMSPSNLFINLQALKDHVNNYGNVSQAHKSLPDGKVSKVHFPPVQQKGGPSA